MAKDAPRAGRATLGLWLWCCTLALGTFAAYALTSLASAGGELVLPLDDAYIHMQYARQLARGLPYQYNDGLGPSSGATSLLYPYLLAAGWLLGLRDLGLGWWALLIGTGSLLAAAWALVTLARHAGLGVLGQAVLGTLTLLIGPFAWHSMSGMETMLLGAFMLWGLVAIVQRWAGGIVLFGVLLALTRPEGAAMGGLLGLVGLWTLWPDVRDVRRVFFLGPLLAAGVQPLVNLMLTGSASAAGSSAKSLLQVVPFMPQDVAVRVLGQWGRIGWELLTGFSPREGLYLPLPLPWLALAGLVWLARQRPRVALLVVGWLLGASAAVATLDPAFWHFKRYQVPLLLLLLVLAAWGLGGLRLWAGWVAAGAVYSVLLAGALWTGGQFLLSYAWNVRAVSQQTLPLARTVAQLPPEAVVAVHDVGLVRYIGGRTTVDMVGLTTPGAADAWRNGPGAVVAFLHDNAHVRRPTHFAAYTDALGLSYLANTSLYGEQLALFSVDLHPRRNVALAGGVQGLWQADWSAAAGRLHSLAAAHYTDGMTHHTLLDVASLRDEEASRYTWTPGAARPGFPTEVYQHSLMGAAPGQSQHVALDSGRRIGGEESFDTSALPGADQVLLTRVHAQYPGTIDVYVEGQFVATRVIPQLPGYWLDIPTLIPGSVNTTTPNRRVRIVAHVPNGHYMPYIHASTAGVYTNPPPQEPARAEFQQGQVALHSVLARQDRATLWLDLAWSALPGVHGDVMRFVHLYDEPSQPPVAQSDGYAADGSLPLGNWLPGALRERVALYLTDVPPGRYALAVGFYHAQSFARVDAIALRGGSVQDDRYFVGMVTVQPW